MAGLLLTGGSGFLGRHLARSLRQHGHEIMTPGRPDLDLLDRASIDWTLSDLKPDIVVHAAAYYGGIRICSAEPAEIFYRNTLMSVHLLDAAARGGVKRFLAVGSACAYPGDLDGNMSEEQLWSGPMHPAVEAYGLSKRLQGVGLRAYAGRFPMKGHFPLLASLYGEHDVFGEYRSHVAAGLIKKFADAVRQRAREVTCWGTGRPVREFMYAGDAAEALCRLLDTDCTEAINIGTGIGTSIKELSELVAELTGFTGKIVWDTNKPDGTMRKVLDVTQMKETLHWQPATSLRAGLEKTIRWYLTNKEVADARQ